jgi:integrase
VRAAIRQAGIAKKASCHTFRHSFSTHLLEDGYDSRMVKDLLGYKDVRTTMVYAHVLNRGGAASAARWIPSDGVGRAVAGGACWSARWVASREGVRRHR